MTSEPVSWYSTSVMNQKSQQTVCVGLSGGVDSSVTAALLKEQGYAVVGVYMKNWDDASPTLGAHPIDPDRYRNDCPWYDDYLDAKRVALQLDIPFYLWDFRQAYKTKVFDHFIDEFAAGRTPNPDIYCNSLIKFDDFQRRALEELKVDFVATGHYAKKIDKKKESITNYKLVIPKDVHKDQTYFLYRLNQEQLATALFPLGDYTKDEVRQLAKKFDLPTKYKKDSQGICFIGQVEVRDFISRWLAPKPGAIHDEAGQVIGEHQGVHLQTIGEKISIDKARLVKLYPEYQQAVPTFYVAEKKVADNILVAVPGVDHPALYKKEATLEQLHWQSVDAEQILDQPVLARLRHGGALVGCQFNRQTGTVAFNEPQRAVTPGQHLVFYSKDKVVLGGGVVSS